MALWESRGEQVEKLRREQPLLGERERAKIIFGSREDVRRTMRLAEILRKRRERTKINK
jgi:hypothetical protein